MRWRPIPSVGIDDAAGLSSRIAHSAGALAEVGIGVSLGLADAAVGAARSGREIAGEAVRTLPRLARLGRLQPHTKVSLGGLMAEQANRAPEGECFLFDDRVHTNAAVDHRIDEVVRGLIAVGIRQGARIGVLMDTSPSAVVAIAALSRLGAVAVLLPPDDDLAAAVQLCEVADIVTDPHHLAAAAATGARVLILGQGHRTADLGHTESDRIVELDRLDLSGERLPQWYRPNPGRASDLAFVFFSTTGGRRAIKEVTNHRWALSAYGTATAAALGRGDTIYCLTPLHHPSGLMVSLGGAVAGGSRIALTRGVHPTEFADEVHRYGVTVVSYTWAMLSELVEATSPELQEHHPIRLFIGAGMPIGLWHKVTERFAPARVLEFYASTEGDAVLANVAGTKTGAKGRPLPGSTEIRLGGYDAATGRFIEDDARFRAPLRGRRGGRAAGEVAPRTRRRTRVDARSFCRGRYLDHHGPPVSPRQRRRLLVCRQQEHRDPVDARAGLLPADLRCPRRHHGDRPGRGLSRCDRRARRRGRSRDARQRRQPHRGQPDQRVE